MSAKGKGFLIGFAAGFAVCLIVKSATTPRPNGQ